MLGLRRLVWWKCLFWAAVGCGAGAVVVAYRPEPGIPAGARRVSAEELVATLWADPKGGDGIYHLVLYPERDGVRLVTFDLEGPGASTAAFALLHRPLITAYQLRRDTGVGSDLSLRRVFTTLQPAAAFRGRLAEPAALAVVDTERQPGHRWASVVDLLDQRKAARPGFTYATAWWAGDRWRRQVPVLAGGVLVGLLGAGLTRRSAADVAAADLLRSARSTPSSVAVPVGPTAADLSKVREMDALLTERLQAGDDAADGTTAAADQTAMAATGSAEAAPTAAFVPVPLATAEADPTAPEVEAEAKSYAGVYYPTVRRGGPAGFSLVELLVSVGVIGVLVALLLPALAGARRSADTITCEANLASIGQGMAVYLAQDQNTYPPSYVYIGQTIIDNVQKPTSPSAGYVHWSSYLYGSGAIPARAFTCPAMDRGGMPPTNTPPGNRNPGQVCPSDTVVDQQVPRLAYALNEAVCPRNKFIAASFAGNRSYRYVKATEVARSSATVLATEMIDNAAALSYDDLASGWIMSHRPIPGFLGVDGELDLFYIPQHAGYRRTTLADLDPDPTSVATDSRTRLDLVGRNHGKKAGYPDRRLSNFLYCDGHAETKSVYDTVQPFQWGDRCYSLQPNDDLVQPTP